MNKALQQKLLELPKTPGVYFFRNKKNEIIYVGKAAVLSKRVRSYFQKNHQDYKTPILVENIYSLDWIEALSEIEALFLEAEFIRRYKPVFNVREKDDKNFLYVRVGLNEEFATVNLVRRPADDKARYYGPFVAGYQLKQALRYLRKIFPYYSRAEKKLSSKLEYQIGVVPSPTMSEKDYRRTIVRLCMLFEGKTKKLLGEIEKEMKLQAKNTQFEQAAILRNQYIAIKGLSTKSVFAGQEVFDIQLDAALQELSELLGLKRAPQRIECYDISNISGTDAVSSMVVFTRGVPDQKEYRHFKMRTKGPNDFAMMAETLHRRFSKRNSAWQKPDLLIVDGGKGQLSAAKGQLAEDNIEVPIVGLAKRYETIVQYEQDAPSSTIGRREGEFLLYNFEDNSALLYLLQRIRDEAHRFAITYHRTLRKKRTESSLLDTITGVGPKTRHKLVRHFGGVRAIAAASEQELALVVGVALAHQIYSALESQRPD